ncbi:MAG: hypothetical protein H0X25_13405 [Acidobacteriales bacterium]|nr:hypothetical protein [Terriglobales bacterium]
MIEGWLVPENTTVTAKGDGPAIEVAGAGSRVFLLTLNISEIIEQESLDVSVYGSADGATWSAKPVVAFPQKFYRGTHPILLDLNADSATKYVRAHWEVNRWGRGVDTPMFQFSVQLKEVPADVLQEATAEAKSLL